jgi:hypothetical protein
MDPVRTSTAPPIVPEDMRLTGLDGSNPLGFLAAMGLLRLLDDRARATAGERPRLHWMEDGFWMPVLTPAYTVDDVAAAVLEDAAAWRDDPAFLLAYDETGTELVDPRDADGKFTRDLKPRPGAMRHFLLRLANAADQPAHDMVAWLAARRSMETGGAYGSEVVQDNNGNTKPLAFHFTAGQQRFLDALEKIRAGLTADDVREALHGPWTGSSPLPSMSWDSTVARDYALRASDPSVEKRGSTPAADWLAFVGLGLFLVAPDARGRLATGCIRGGWKDSAFTWPLWDTPASAAAVRCLLALDGMEELGPGARRQLGIAAIWSADITRSDQGGYGAFSPARFR